MVRIYDEKYRELVSSSLDQLRNTTDITQLTPGGKARSLLEICMRELGTAYKTFSQDLLQAFVKYATGDNLDLIGELFGLTRRKATRNSASSTSNIQKFYVESGTFGSINGGSSITVPAGTEVITKVTTSTQQAITYILSSDLTCSAASNAAYASITAVEFGTVSNVGAGALTIHNFEQYTDYLNESLKTINIEGIAYAEDEESDDNFRYRITNQSLSDELANYTAIRVASLEVPGVADATLDEYSKGIGTGTVYVKSVSPPASESLIANVQDALDRVRAYGNLVEAKAPLPVGVELVVKLNLYKTITSSQEDALKREVRDRIYRYINGLDINEDLETDLLVREILSVDSNIRSTGTTSRPIDNLYIWKYSAAEDQRVRREALDGYVARNFERVMIEFSALPDNQDPITVRV